MSSRFCCQWPDGCEKHGQDRVGPLRLCRAHAREAGLMRRAIDLDAQRHARHQADAPAPPEPLDIRPASWSEPRTVVINGVEYEIVWDGTK
jgi:hypothetical protein